MAERMAERMAEDVTRITYKVNQAALHKAILSALADEVGCVFNETTKVIIRCNSRADVITEYVTPAKADQ
jgi:hypothetical protein